MVQISQQLFFTLRKVIVVIMGATSSSPILLAVKWNKENSDVRNCWKEAWNSETPQYKFGTSAVWCTEPHDGNKANFGGLSVALHVDDKLQ